MGDGDMAEPGDNVSTRLPADLLALQEGVGHEDQGKVVLLCLETAALAVLQAKQLGPIPEGSFDGPAMTVQALDRAPVPVRVATDQKTLGPDFSH